MGEELPAYQGNGAELVTQCFSAGLGNLGGYLVSLCVMLFAFATIIAWYYMGKQAVAYLEETTGFSVATVYTFIYLACVFFGCLGPMETMWKISDVFNGLMAIPNLLALLFLVKEVHPPRN